MKSIDIKGKSYVMVHSRIMHFREKHPGWSLTSEIVDLSEDRVVMKATILDENNEPIAVGHAYEDRESTFINKTSFIENCETSAWGRALANLGIGIDESIASADEVGNAIKQQADKPWLEHKDFGAAIRKLNETEDDSERQQIYHKLDTTYKMKKDYRKQLLEVVKQRDINV